LCNDEKILGPWVNSFRMNAFTMFIIAVLVTLSLILTAAVLFPTIGSGQIETILGAGIGLAFIAVLAYALRAKRNGSLKGVQLARARQGWRMPELDTIGPLQLTPMRRACMIVLRGYLAVAVVMVVIRVMQTATS
jgi:hypothetical protein